MKLVIQRVKSGKVTVENKIVGEIRHGFFVLLGVGKKDTEKEADVLAEKISKLRIMSDETGKMNKSVSDVSGSFLVVSQFTLYADTSGGNRPSFLQAGGPDEANRLYEYFVNKLRSFSQKVETGTFGADMTIDVILDGPVTILIEA